MPSTSWRNSKCWRIGLLAPRAHHFYAYEIVEGMRAVGIRPGQRILPVDLLYSRDEEIPALLATSKLDALILGLDQGRYQRYAEVLPMIPMVNVHPDLLRPEIPTIAIDPLGLALATVNYFRSLGIPHLAGAHADTTEAQQRVNSHLGRIVVESGGSFRDFALPGFGMVTGYETHRSLPELEEFDQWLLKLDHPTGLLASGGFTAVTTIRSAARVGLSIPDSLSVLSRSDDNICLFNDPQVSCFRSVGARIGEIAISLLIQHLNGASLPSGEIGLPAPSIVERESTGIPAGVEPSLRAAVHFIRRNALKGITVDDVLAAVPGISRSHLYRRFEEQFGNSPAQEIMRLRLAEAQHQLRFTRKSLNEVADHCGFKTLAHFSTVFSREMGVAPRVWRAANRFHA